MANGIETGIGGVFQTPQTVAGTIERYDATTMRRLPKPPGGDALGPAKTFGREAKVTGKFWNSPQSFVESIGGNVGSLAAQGQVVIAAFLWAQFLGSDVVTGSGDPYTHTISTGTAVPVTQTIYQTVGQNIGPVNWAFYDAKIGRLSSNAGQSQQILRLTEDIVALRAAEWFSTIPTARDDGTDALLWAQFVTRVNGVALPELDGDTLDFDAGLDVHRGQTPAPVCFIYGEPQGVRTASGIVTDGTLPHVHRALYGTDTPANGQAVSNDVMYAALSSTATQNVRRTLTYETPRVEIRPDDWQIGPKAEGGRQELTFGGTCMDSATRPMLIVTALTGDSRAYV